MARSGFCLKFEIRRVISRQGNVTIRVRGIWKKATGSIQRFDKILLMLH